MKWQSIAITLAVFLSIISFPASLQAQGAAFEEVRKILSSDAAAGDQFGIWAAVSGDVAVVGAFLDDEAGADSGAAYIFARNHGGVNSWGQVTKITATDAVAGERFGQAVAIDGHTAIIGAPDAAGGGAVYVFDRNQGGVGNWGQVAKLTAATASFNAFGEKLSISGDTVAVGARVDDTAANNAGAVYVFERHQGGTNNWGQVRQLLASDAASNDFLGFSVSVHGDTLVAGAVGGDDACPADPICDSGAAYVFERNQGGANNWGELRKLLAPDAASPDLFGETTAISEDVIVVGAAQESDSIFNSGSAYIFQRNQGGTNAWGFVRKLKASDAAAADFFGKSVSISGDLVAVGAISNDDACPADSGCNSGSAYLFERHAGGTNQWGEVKKLTASDAGAGDFFGNSLTLSGETIIVGARFNDDACPADPSCNSGSAYLFSTPASTASPSLEVPLNLSAVSNLALMVPITFTGNGLEIAATVFSLDFDESCLDFDPTDADSDGIPDSIFIAAPGDFTPSVTFASGDTAGELDFTLADFSPPLASLEDGVLATVTLTPVCVPTGANIIAPIDFGLTPAVSFGDTSGQSVPGTTSNGSVEIVGGVRGDCNGDGLIDAGDIAACVLEVFDGDGSVWADVVGGTFSGNPVGCDANGDFLVDAGDFSCKILLIFQGAGACDAQPFEGQGMVGGGAELRLGHGQSQGSGELISIPITFEGAEYEVTAAAFSIDYDEDCLSFDPTDEDGDGVPDAISWSLPTGITPSVGFDASDVAGELNISFLDLSLPLATLENGVVGTLRFTTLCEPGDGSITAHLRFGEPPLSFGNTLGQGVEGLGRPGVVKITSAFFYDGFESGSTEGWSNTVP